MCSAYAYRMSAGTKESKDQTLSTSRPLQYLIVADQSRKPALYQDPVRYADRETRATPPFTREIRVNQNVRSFIINDNMGKR